MITNSDFKKIRRENLGNITFTIFSTDLQRSILELIHVLASQSIEPTELAAFLKLFNAEQPPLGMLLNSLHRLVASATYNTPDCILTFPVDSDNTGKLHGLLQVKRNQ